MQFRLSAQCYPILTAHTDSATCCYFQEIESRCWKICTMSYGVLGCRGWSMNQVSMINGANDFFPA